MSGQPEPHVLWPNVKWINITPQYAGVFFRAEGAGSNAFGQVQDQQARTYQFLAVHPQREGIDQPRFSISQNIIKVKEVPNNDQIRDPIGNNGPYVQNDKHKNEEIRPRNQAIRIWRRNG